MILSLMHGAFNWLMVEDRMTWQVLELDGVSSVSKALCNEKLGGLLHGNLVGYCRFQAFKVYMDLVCFIHVG